MKTKLLHYNFNCVARIPEEMYNRLWADENPWENDPDIIKEVKAYLGIKSLYSIDRTES